MFAAIVLGIVTLGPPILVDQYHKGNLPDQAPTCKVENVSDSSDGMDSSRFLCGIIVPCSSLWWAGANQNRRSPG